MRYVIGLGNPGRVYAETRHNVGFGVLDALARDAGARFVAVHPLFSACDLYFVRTPVRLIKPMTFMNRSGVALRLAISRPVCHEVLAVFDDMALPLGGLRLRPKGRAGGHNGMASLVETLGTHGFPRLRLGIGPAQGPSVVNHVLSPFLPQEQPVAEEMIRRGAAAVQCWIEHGLDWAMNRYNV